MTRRKKGEDGVSRNTENPFYRKGEVYKLYGRWEEFINKFSDLVISKKDLMFQDVMPDKRDQALIFRAIKVFGFNGGGLEFLAWVSLARVVADLELSIADKTASEAFQIMISMEKEIKKDLVNILYLYAKDAQLFYDYLEFEIEKKAFPFFKIAWEKDEKNLIEIAKLSAIAAAFKGIFFWEIKTGEQHPGRHLLKELGRI